MSSAKWWPFWLGFTVLTYFILLSFMTPTDNTHLYQNCRDTKIDVTLWSNICLSSCFISQCSDPHWSITANERCGSIFTSVFFKLILWNHILSTSCEIGHKWVAQNPIGFKYWPGAIRQKAITLANVDLGLCPFMSSLGRSAIQLVHSDEKKIFWPFVYMRRHFYLQFEAKRLQVATGSQNMSSHFSSRYIIQAGVLQQNRNNAIYHHYYYCYCNCYYCIYILILSLQWCFPLNNLTPRDSIHNACLVFEFFREELAFFDKKSIYNRMINNTLV